MMIVLWLALAYLAGLLTPLVVLFFMREAVVMSVTPSDW